MVGQLSRMAVLPEKDCGVAGADLLLSMCIKVLAQTVAAVPALCFTLLPRLSLADADRQARLEQAATGSCAAGYPPPEPCLASESSVTDSTASEEHAPTTCKVRDETLAGPDTSVRLKSKEINAWLAVLKNKDDDDDDEDDEDEEDEEDDEDDVADEDDVGDEGEGEEAEGLAGGVGGNDDEDDEDDDDENGKGDDEEEEDEDAVEAEDEEDEDGVEDEEEDDEDDEDDEAPEPPQKKRK